MRFLVILLGLVLCASSVEATGRSKAPPKVRPKVAPRLVRHGEHTYEYFPMKPGKKFIRAWSCDANKRCRAIGRRPKN